MDTPAPARVRRWRVHLAEERAEARVYRALAGRRSGAEHEILLELADAEDRHARHWIDLLGPASEPTPRVPLRSRLLIWLAGHFGSVFVLALMQRAEERARYDSDSDAPAAMVADERIHAEVVRALAVRGRSQLSGAFRAAVFGANDGLVSNLALIMGIGATGVATPVILATGLAGLLAGALSMGAGEYISVRSQRELLIASEPAAAADTALPQLDVDDNELALVYRARGMSAEQAQKHAEEVLAGLTAPAAPPVGGHEELGTARGAAVSSFGFFASGAAIPVLPYLIGMSGWPAVVMSLVLVSIALCIAGAVVGLLSGTSPLTRALRQLAIGLGAAGITWCLGSLFDVVAS